MWKKQAKRILAVLCTAVLLATLSLNVITVFAADDTVITDFEGMKLPEEAADWKIGMGSGSLLFAGGNPLQGEKTLQINYDVPAGTQTRLHYEPAGEPVLGDGLRFVAAAPTPAKVRINVCKNWEQGYAEIVVDATPREYIIPWAALKPFGSTPVPAGGGTQFIYFIVAQDLQGDTEGYVSKSHWFLDNIRYYTGDAAADLTGTPTGGTLPEAGQVTQITVESLENFEAQNDANAIPNWRIGMGNGKLYFAKGSAMEGSKTLQYTYDASADQVRLHYEPAGEPVLGDGLRFLAAAPTPVKMRVTVCKNWVQGYVDIVVDTTPRLFTIRWDELTPFGDPVQPAGGTNFVYFVVYSGDQDGVEGYDSTSSVFLDDVSYFVGGAEHNILGTPQSKLVLPIEREGEVTPTTTKVLENFNALENVNDLTEWMMSTNGTLRRVTAGALEGSTTLQIGYDFAKNDAFRLDYNAAGLPAAEDGFKIVLAATSPTVLRLSACMDNYQQRYYDLYVDTTPREYTCLLYTSPSPRDS